jgi:curli production assembly/transport component CsgE
LKKTLIYIALFILSTTSLFGQADTVKVDSLQKVKVERYLQKLIEEATATAKEIVYNYDQLEIDELIVNATFSKPGNDFFYYYSNSFIWPEASGDFIVQVTERPFRLNSTQITIKVNDLEVFQNMLQPRTSYLEELAAYAQRVTANYIVNYQQIMKELDGDDRTGSGIY